MPHFVLACPVVNDSTITPPIAFKGYRDNNYPISQLVISNTHLQNFNLKKKLRRQTS